MLLNRTLVAALLTASLISATDLTGRVTSAGKPLPGATVTARSGTATETVSTNEDGSFRLGLAASGPVDLDVALFGFKPFKLTVSPDGSGKLLALSMELMAPMLPLRPVGGQTLQARTQSLGAQTAEALASGVPAAESRASDGTESADSVLVQGSTQSAATDFTQGPQGFGPGGQGPGPEGGFPGASEGMGGAGGGGGFGGAGGGFGGGGGSGGRGGGGFGVGQGRGGGLGGGGAMPNLSNMSSEERAKAIAEMRARRGGAGPQVFGNNTSNRGQQYRGGAFWNFRNSGMDASPFALNGASVNKPSYNNSTYGASLGGPLPFPAAWSKDSFFFLNYTARAAQTATHSMALSPRSPSAAATSPPR